MNHEEMKDVFMRQYKRYLQGMKKEKNINIRRDLFMASRGALFLASLLNLVDADEEAELQKGAERGMYESDPLQFEEVPEEEQETLKVEDLPFPEVMEQEEQPAVPFEMMDAEERADEFFKSPEEPEEAEQKNDEESAKELLKKRYDFYVMAVREECDKELRRHYFNMGCGMLDFAMELGIIDFAENFCMFDELSRVKRESFLRSEEVRKQRYVESRYEYWLDVCRKPDGCDEEQLNYLHGYFTMAGELGAVTMHRAEDMVHELTHECGKSCSLLEHLLEVGQDPEKYMLLADGISVINRALVHEASHPDEGLRDALEALREKYTDVIKRMKEGWNGVVTNESLLDIREWIDDQADWLD